MTTDCSNELPSVGDAFAFSLSDGRYSACRILQKEKRFGEKMHVLVACSEWIGTRIPSFDDPLLQPILRLTHHSHFGKFLLIWVSSPPPSELISIGTIPLTDSDKNLSSSSYGYWDAITCQPLMQWRWDNERDAVLQSDEIIKTHAETQKNEQARLRAEFLSRITLTELRLTKFFKNWEQSLPPDEITASRNIMSNTIGNLLDLEVTNDASLEQRLQVLRDCILGFNELENKAGFIYSNERDDIYFVLEEVAAAANISEFLDGIFDLGNW